MSKYQILKNADTSATLTDDDEQHFVIFDNDDDHNHQSTRSYGDDDRDHRNDYRARDLIEYNDTMKYDDNDNDDDDNSKCFVNNRLNASKNNNHSTGKVCITNGGNNSNNNGGLRCTSASSNNLLITTLEADESTMEIPLLQHGYCNNNNKNYANNNKDESEYACLCQQKGFACNLNSKSTQTAKSKILWAIGMCCIFMIVEFLGGYIAGSLAIMTDAAHLASDCISFVIGLVAIWLGNKPPDAKMSFGYKRLEVMGAIISILSIWILTATLVLVAIQRIFAHDYDLDADTMMTISGIGILINIIMIFILHTSSVGLPEGGIIGAAHGHSHSHSHNHSHSDNHHGHSHHSPRSQRRPLANDNSHWHPELLVGPTVTTSTAVTGAGSGSGSDVDISGAATSIELSSGSLVLDGNGLKHQQDGSDVNLNLRAATIHAIGDLVQSFGVFIASVLIKLYPTAVILDPLCTMLFSVIVIMTTINLFKESMHIIMDSVPKGISVSDLEMDLLNIEGVKSVHHMNVWNHTTGHTIFMAHLVIDLLVDSNTVLIQATQLLNSSKYKVKHSTIQMERVTT